MVVYTYLHGYVMCYTVRFSELVIPNVLKYAVAVVSRCKIYRAMSARWQHLKCLCKADCILAYITSDTAYV
jgi:hypothetical protein